MDRLDYCWSTVETISRKGPEEIRVLLDETIDYPKLETDSSGFVLRLSPPRFGNDDSISMHGLTLTKDEPRGKSFALRMFNASLEHLSLHAALSDFGIYSDLAKRYENQNNVIFAISLVEDHSIRAYAKRIWPGLLEDFAYANIITFLRFKKMRSEETVKQVCANLLSLFMTGRLIADLGESMNRSLVSLNDLLKSLEASPLLRPLPDPDQSDFSSRKIEFDSKKKELVRTLLDFFETNSIHLSSVFSLPYAESYGKNYLFDSLLLNTPEPDSWLFEAAHTELGIRAGQDREGKKRSLHDLMQLEDEAIALIYGWHEDTLKKNKIILQYRRANPQNHFNEIRYPEMDYSEYFRTRKKMSGRISKYNYNLRLLRSDFLAARDPPRVEGRHTHDGHQISKENWAVLVDASRSLERGIDEAKETSVSLCEAASGLLSDDAWACYAFHDDFLILKDYGERYNNAVRARLGALSNRGRTLLPDAIMTILPGLSSSQGEARILAIASDGLPTGYEGIDEELIRVARHVAGLGITLVGFGIRNSSILKYFRFNYQWKDTYTSMNNLANAWLKAQPTY